VVPGEKPLGVNRTDGKGEDQRGEQSAGSKEKGGESTWNPPLSAVSEVRDVVGKVIVSSILGENVKAAADQAALEMAKIMEKTQGK
jgi:hypothetical protein